MSKSLRRFIPPKISTFAGVMLALAIALPASGAILHFAATLDGLQEVPPNNSPATGTADVILDTVANTITVDLHFQGLVAPQTAAHIHGPAPPGVNAGILVGFPLGQFDNQVFPITDTIEGHMINNLTYVNVHSQTFPGGEIRGQLLPQPVSVEESSWSYIKALYH
jgi:hypothetical protein